MGHKLPEHRPIAAHTSPAHIRKAEVKVVNGSVCVDLLNKDHWSVVVLYLTPEAALQLSDEIEDAADDLIAQSMRKVTLEELLALTEASGESDATR